jgi:hypothetical protein
VFTTRRSILASVAGVALAGFAVLGAAAPANACTLHSSTAHSSTAHSSTVHGSTVDRSTVDRSTVDRSTVDTSTTVGICKATGSVKHPYVFVLVKTDKLLAGHYGADDIVPAFTYTTADGVTQIFTGQHTSSTVLTADCVPVVAVSAFLM